MTRRPATPGVGKRLLGLIYEALLLVAVILPAGIIAAAFSQIANPEYTRPITQAFVVVACASYFAWQWHRSGQTLPMKTWHMRIETADGASVTLPRALLRLALATTGYLLLGISVLWAFVDRDRQFLHDRLAGTRLVKTE